MKHITPQSVPRPAKAQTVNQLTSLYFIFKCGKDTECITREAQEKFGPV